MKKALKTFDKEYIAFICFECDVTENELFSMDEDELYDRVYEKMFEIECEELIEHEDEEDTERCTLASDIVTILGNTLPDDGSSLEDNIQNTILKKENIDNFSTPDQIRELINIDNSEATLAFAYSLASNKIDLEIYVVESRKYPNWSYPEYRKWCTLAEELYNKIVTILKNEGYDIEAMYDSSRDNIEPFMSRNGYCYKLYNWYIKDDDK